MSVLKRLVDISEPDRPRLNLLLEGRYELKELFYLIKSSTGSGQRSVGESEGTYSDRVISVRQKCCGGQCNDVGSRSGQGLDQSKPQLMYLVLSKSEIYGYNEMLAPAFKLNLKDCVLRKEMATAASSSQHSGPRIILPSPLDRV